MNGLENNVSIEYCNKKAILSKGMWFFGGLGEGYFFNEGDTCLESNLLGDKKDVILQF